MTEKDSKELMDIISKATVNFRGNVKHLHTAIGILFVGRELGWKPLLLIHDKKTLRRCEDILGVEFKEIFPEVGPNADKSLAWRGVQKVSSYWKAVRGEITGVRTPDMD